MRISILFLISSFNSGGAEMMLYRLIRGMDRSRFAPQVISLVDIDLAPLNEKFRSMGVPLRSLGMHPGRPNPLSVVRLAQWLREDQPDLIHTWMYHADLLGGLAAKLAGDIPVAWGIRHCNLSRNANKWLTLQTAKACARMSGWLPAKIICNSEAARNAHAAVGYAKEKMLVIHNGSDLATFNPDPAAREVIRKELQIPEGSVLIGLIGRFHPQKDHRNFVQAAALLYRDHPDVQFLLCGDGVTWENPQLVRWIQEAGISRHCRLLGLRHDIPRLMAALDIATSSSIGESFANVIVEAMSCGVPCVVTDVGDSALIVGGRGRVVPPKNPAALSSAWRELIELGQDERARLGMAARMRVTEHFAISNMVARYQNIYQELADGAR